MLVPDVDFPLEKKRSKDATDLTNRKFVGLVVDVEEMGTLQGDERQLDRVGDELIDVYPPPLHPVVL